MRSFFAIAAIATFCAVNASPLASTTTTLAPAKVLHMAPAVGSPSPDVEVAIQSAKNWCMFLPSSYGNPSVADSEPTGKSFCSSATVKTAINNNTYTAIRRFPTGFITSASFAQDNTNGSAYTQVTGCINRSKYGLSPTDGGGQFDIVSTPGAFCQGYKYFVNLVEPDAQRYCIRCCQNSKQCNRGISQDGCETVISNGNYAGCN